MFAHVCQNTLQRYGFFIFLMFGNKTHSPERIIELSSQPCFALKGREAFVHALNGSKSQIFIILIHMCFIIWLASMLVSMS